MPEAYVDKLHRISERSDTPINHIGRYMLKFAIAQNYLKYIQPHSVSATRTTEYSKRSNERVKAGLPALEVPFRIPESWHKDLHELAWQYEVSRESGPHLAGQLLMHALNSYEETTWAKFFKNHGHIITAIKEIISDDA